MDNDRHSLFPIIRKQTKRIGFVTFAVPYLRDYLLANR